MFAEVTSTQVGVWVGCAVLFLGLIAALMSIGSQLEKRFITREKFDGLDERVKAIESEKRSVADNARSDKHMQLVLDALEHLSKARK